MSCKMPLTKRLMPYVDVRRSVPNMSAMMTAVMPTYVPELKPKKAQHIWNEKKIIGLSVEGQSISQEIRQLTGK